jgi:hypothetical protein
MGGRVRERLDLSVLEWNRAVTVPNFLTCI